jgi:hypothetical protein
MQKPARVQRDPNFKPAKDWNHLPAHWTGEYYKFDEHDPGPPRDKDGNILSSRLAKCTAISGRKLPSVLRADEHNAPRTRPASKTFV